MNTCEDCKAALRRACTMGSYEPRGEWVLLDDAASCMAEREAKLREALQDIAWQNLYPEMAKIARAALAAAQEKP